MDQLAKHVQGLIPELYNYIYELTFTTEPETRDITRQYKPSSLLQVDRASRNAYAQVLYGGATFYVHCHDHDNHYLRHQACCTNWFLSLPQAHVEMIRCIRWDPAAPNKQYEGMKACEQERWSVQGVSVAVGSLRELLDDQGLRPCRQFSFETKVLKKNYQGQMEWGWLNEYQRLSRLARREAAGL